MEKKDNNQKKYDLKKLIKNTDWKSIREDKEIQEWQNMKPVGKEII